MPVDVAAGAVARHAVRPTGRAPGCPKERRADPRPTPSAPISTSKRRSSAPATSAAASASARALSTSTRAKMKCDRAAAARGGEEPRLQIGAVQRAVGRAVARSCRSPSGSRDSVAPFAASRTTSAFGSKSPSDRRRRAAAAPPSRSARAGCPRRLPQAPARARRPRPRSRARKARSPLSGRRCRRRRRQRASAAHAAGR